MGIHRQNFPRVCSCGVEDHPKSSWPWDYHTALLVGFSVLISHSAGGQGWPGSGSIFWLCLDIHDCLGPGLLSFSIQRKTVFNSIAVIRHHDQGALQKGVFKLEHVVSKGQSLRWQREGVAAGAAGDSYLDS